MRYVVASGLALAAFAATAQYPAKPIGFVAPGE
jgi:hypothetical protein